MHTILSIITECINVRLDFFNSKEVFTIHKL